MSRTLLFLLLVLASLAVWWPGLYQEETFRDLAFEEVSRSRKTLSAVSNHLGELFEAPDRQVSEGASDVLSGLFPKAAQEEDALYDAAPASFFERIFLSPYFESMKAMASLSCVRLILALAWFAVLSPLLLASALDAWVVRRLKYESFAVHHPVLYQFALSAPSVLLLAALITFMTPWFIPAWVAGVFYAAFLASVHLLIAQFHRFG